MTKRQLERVVPGFMRVEVIVNETNRGAQKHVDSIPIDHEFDYGEGAIHRDIDPSICCHVYMEPNEGTGNIPEIPPADHLIVWETNIKAFSLRLLTKKSDVLDWVVLMQGPGKLLTEDEKIGGFWSGRHGAFKKEKKSSGEMFFHPLIKWEFQIMMILVRTPLSSGLDRINSLLVVEITAICRE
eukprot:CAMPEP_0170969266 /NCGR_PEP_ID=MMETSP0735-20130129/43840_1 /TAXON_ID=186038 /ORGANISM="Fragilariopsis kerguelensis, Strain L26-C5" /LENGTH=183 /DNA_ID=CAMNT_0011388631 /DNA_START=519 /DNA_END=1073 /DNA_ORIENTATION=-